MPTKSASDFVFVAGSFASFHSGDPVPNTFVMSPEAEVELFSSTMFAVETPPTLQPAFVYVTHGAGAVWPPSPTMFGIVSVVPSTVSVQYLNDEVKRGTPVPW